MKTTNVFFLSALLMLVCGCSRPQSEPESDDKVVKAVIVNESEYEDVTSALFVISEMKIEGDCLKIKIGSSGCSGSSWVAKLIAQEGIAKSNPPIRSVKLFLDNKELCQAFIAKEFAFDIEDLRVPDCNQVYLSISGKSILYEY